MADNSAKLPLVDLQEYDTYQHQIMHRWMRTLAMLGILLVPAFFILDIFMIPKELLPLFALFRGVATGIAIAQVIVLRLTKPSPWTLFHGYLFSFVVAGAISLMTTQLGGFDSPYYAGINLVIMGANLLLPWEWWHAAINSLILLASYVVANLIWGPREPAHLPNIINNLYFLSATAFISVAINFVKGRLIHAEFGARIELKHARDALWGEMAVAKQIQTALLPQVHDLSDYEVAATMLPADEVGGDYYDVIRLSEDKAWIGIGDVSGHGVESGLVMMMTQTSIFTSLEQQKEAGPAQVLSQVNRVIKENMQRMGSSRYMTLTLLRIDEGTLTFAGKHQDLMIYRAASQQVEIVETPGTWIGILDDLDGLLEELQVSMNKDDILLLFTDGVTEGSNAAGEMYSDERLLRQLKKNATLPVDSLIESIKEDVLKYISEQRDDITLVALRRK